MHDIDWEEDYYGDVERLLEALDVEDYRTVDAIINKGVALDTHQIYGNLSHGRKGVRQLEHLWRPYRLDLVINEDSEAMSPLEISSDVGNIEVIKFLYNKGARVTPEAFIIALRNMNLEVLELLLSLDISVYDQAREMKEFDDTWNTLSGRDRLAVSDLLYDYGL